jgi:Skp family chaperone for outer membrane proteins
VSPPSGIAVFDLSACFDKENVPKIKDIDRELKDFADEAARKMKGAPEEREKLKAQYMEFYDRKKLEIYVVVDQIVSAIGKERGYAAIFRTHRLPQLIGDEKGESLNMRINHRGLMFNSPDVDITQEVLIRLNKAFASSPKKDF